MSEAHLPPVAVPHPPVKMADLESCGDVACRTTYRWEKRRAVGAGVCESFGATFFLLIAIKYHHAGTVAQSIVAAGGFAGMFLNPLLLEAIRRLRLPVGRAAAFLSAWSALCLAVTALWSRPEVFVTGGVLALIGATGCIPLMTEIYRQNYPDHSRGALFGSVNRIKVLILCVFSGLVGWALKQDWSYASIYLAVVAAAFALSAFCFNRIPGVPLPLRPGRLPYQSLRLLRSDRAFLWLLIMYFFMGFGNIMMMPLRVKVLVEPGYGYEYSPAMVALLTGVIPPLTIFIFSRMWGRLFDRLNFFLLRLILNAFFLGSIWSFFLVGSLVGQILGAFLLGMAFAGGNVAWSLWVTKIAPPEEVADYMSVHTLLTGVRGMLAPILAIPLAVVWPLGHVVALASVLILASMLMLGPEVRRLRPQRS